MRYACSPRAKAAAAQLEHLQHAKLAFGRALGVQRNDRIGNRELRSVRSLITVVLADPERRRGNCRESTGQVVKKTAELSFVGRERSQGFETVDDDVAGLLFLEERVDLVDDTRQPVAVHGFAQVVVEDRRSDRVGVEEGQRLSVAKNLVERLRDGRQEDARRILARVVEEVLLGENRLAGAGVTDDQIDPVRRQPAAEERVEPSCPLAIRSI